jgi:hypothetical protein
MVKLSKVSESSYGMTAYAQSLGQAAVVTRQGDHYVINPLINDPHFPKGRFSFKRESLSSESSLREVVGGL